MGNSSNPDQIIPMTCDFLIGDSALSVGTHRRLPRSCSSQKRNISVNTLSILIKHRDRVKDASLEPT